MEDEDDVVDGNADDSKDDSGESTPKKHAAFTTWHDALPDEHKELIKQRYAPLENTLTRLKDERKSLREKIAGIQQDAKLSADEKIAAMQTQLQEAESKASFFESLPAGIKNPRNAYVLAKANDCINSDGTLNKAKFKETCPELFVKTVPPVNGGNGGGGNPNPTDFNANLRRLAGYG